MKVVVLQRRSVVAQSRSIPIGTISGGRDQGRVLDHSSCRVGTMTSHLEARVAICEGLLFVGRLVSWARRCGVHAAASSLIEFHVVLDKPSAAVQVLTKAC